MFLFVQDAIVSNVAKLTMRKLSVLLEHQNGGGATASHSPYKAAAGSTSTGGAFHREISSPTNRNFHSPQVHSLTITSQSNNLSIMTITEFY